MRFPCPNQSDYAALLARIEAHYAPTVVYAAWCAHCRVGLSGYEQHEHADGSLCDACHAHEIGGDK